MQYGRRALSFGLFFLTSCGHAAPPATTHEPIASAPEPVANARPDARPRLDAIATRVLDELTCPPPPLADCEVEEGCGPWAQLTWSEPVECDDFPRVELVSASLEVIDGGESDDDPLDLAWVTVTLADVGGCGGDIEACGDRVQRWLVGRGFEQPIEHAAEDAALQSWESAEGFVVAYEREREENLFDDSVFTEVLVVDAARNAIVTQETCEPWITTACGELLPCGGRWRAADAACVEHVQAITTAFGTAAPSPTPAERTTMTLLSNAPPRALRLAARDGIRAVLGDELGADHEKVQAFTAAWSHVRFLAASPDATQFLVWLDDIGTLARFGGGFASLVEVEEDASAQVTMEVADLDADGRPEWIVHHSGWENDRRDYTDCSIHYEDGRVRSLDDHTCSVYADAAGRDVLTVDGEPILEGEPFTPREALARLIEGVHAPRCEDDAACRIVRSRLVPQVGEARADALVAPFIR